MMLPRRLVTTQYQILLRPRAHAHMAACRRHMVCFIVRSPLCVEYASNMRRICVEYASNMTCGVTVAKRPCYFSASLLTNFIDTEFTQWRIFFTVSPSPANT